MQKYTARIDLSCSTPLALLYSTLPPVGETHAVNIALDLL